MQKITHTPDFPTIVRETLALILIGKAPSILRVSAKSTVWRPYYDAIEALSLQLCIEKILVLGYWVVILVHLEVM